MEFKVLSPQTPSIRFTIKITFSKILIHNFFLILLVFIVLLGENKGSPSIADPYLFEGAHGPTFII